SALDFATDAKLRQALEPVTKNSTVIIVAQRISTIMHAQQIIVLDDKGRMAGIGTHHQLMHSSKVYREIASSQLSTEELAKVDKEMSGAA
ncbi:MAG: ABC transporter ATP-binding protein, partial [Candidatus Saccharimonadales bacterium]